ncbi:MAG TPA: hypothetical protein VNX15_11080 [Gemmatimonadales bacterium]|nr:hypothetical protein [Gemmatimonadales bacterium]
MQKLSANQQRQIDAILLLQKTASKTRNIVVELDSSRAAKPSVINNLCGMIAREMQQMRQRLLTAPVGTVADICGSLSIMASRSGGINMKIRGLQDGLNSIDMQLDQALKSAMKPEEKTDKHPAPGESAAH